MAGALRGAPAEGGTEEVGRVFSPAHLWRQGETSSPIEPLGLGWLWNTHGVREKLLALPHSDRTGILGSGKFSKPPQGVYREGIAG